MAPQPRDRPTNPSVRRERVGPLAHRCGPGASSSFPKRLAGKLPDGFAAKTVLPLPQNPYEEAPRRNPLQNRLRASPKPIWGSCETLSRPNSSASFPITLSGKLRDAFTPKSVLQLPHNPFWEASGRNRQPGRPAHPRPTITPRQRTNQPNNQTL